MTNNIEELNDSLNKLKAEREVLFKEQKAINEKLLKNYDEIEDIKDAIFKIKHSNLTIEDVMSFDWASISGDAYYSCTNFLSSNYDFLFFSGYIPEAENQIHAMLSKANISTENLAKLKELIPLIKESVILENKGKYIGVLGNIDSWHIKLDLLSFNVADLLFKTVTQYSSLEEMLEYVYKYFFIEREGEDY